MDVSLIFTRNSSWISKTIRWLTKSEVSHVSILINTAFGDNMLLDVTYNGYKMIPLELFLNRGNHIVHQMKLNHDVSKGIKVVSRWLGKPYDFKTLLSFVNLFNKIFQRTLSHPMDNPNSLICSEMVTIMLQKSDFPGSEILVPKKTSPNDLMEFLKSSSLAHLMV